MKKSIMVAGALALACGGTTAETIWNALPAPEAAGRRLAWFDEFDRDGRPDPAKWDYEVGFIRNQEDQWYQPENAWCTNGYLVLEARVERKPNPDFDPKAPKSDWKHSRTNIEMTSACVITKGKRSFTYGRMDIRAKIVAEGDLWPALWLLGDSIDEISWPACGEIDILEYYDDSILANFIYGNDFWGFGEKAVYRPGTRVPCKNNSSVRHMDRFLARDPQWAEKWHVWSIERNEITTAIYLDGELLNVHVNELTRNPKGLKPVYPYREPMYLLMNLAIKAHDHDSPKKATYPSRFLIDYVRVYE